MSRQDFCAAIWVEGLVGPAVAVCLCWQSVPGPLGAGVNKSSCRALARVVVQLLNTPRVLVQLQVLFLHSVLLAFLPSCAFS